LTITIGGKNHQVKLNGTIDNPYFCGIDMCGSLGHKNPKKALLTHVKPKFNIPKVGYVVQTLFKEVEMFRSTEREGTRRIYKIRARL
jgi:prophage antirepressor-like protein